MFISCHSIFPVDLQACLQPFSFPLIKFSGYLSCGDAEIASYLRGPPLIHCRCSHVCIYYSPPYNCSRPHIHRSLRTSCNFFCIHLIMKNIVKQFYIENVDERNTFIQIWQKTSWPLRILKSILNHCIDVDFF